jgi:hypothetical protein
VVIANSYNNQLRGQIETIIGSDATGDIYYRDSNGFLTRLAIGAAGSILGITGGLPAWVTGVPPTGNAGGDLTGSYPNPTIALNAVTYAKIQNVSATGRLLGRNSAGAGVIEELDATTGRSLLGLGTAATVNTGTAAGNVPVLDSNGQLAVAVIPSIAITSIQVVADQAARLALNNVQVGDVAKQTDVGLSFILSALPASTDSNWVSIGDTTITASDIVSGTIATARLGSGTANSGSFLRGDQSWQPLPFIALSFIAVTGTTQAIAVNTGYRANNAALVTLTLPSTAAVDTIIRVTGQGAGGWRIAQNAGQQVFFGDTVSTVGTGGRLDSTHFRDCVELICIVANTTWQVVSAIGNIDVV